MSDYFLNSYFDHIFCCCNFNFSAHLHLLHHEVSINSFFMYEKKETSAINLINRGEAILIEGYNSSTASSPSNFLRTFDDVYYVHQTNPIKGGVQDLCPRRPGGRVVVIAEPRACSPSKGGKNRTKGKYSPRPDRRPALRDIHAAAPASPVRGVSFAPLGNPGRSPSPSRSGRGNQKGKRGKGFSDDSKEQGGGKKGRRGRKGKGKK